MKLQQLEPAYNCTWLIAANDDNDGDNEDDDELTSFYWLLLLILGATGQTSGPKHWQTWPNRTTNGDPALEFSLSLHNLAMLKPTECH